MTDIETTTAAPETPKKKTKQKPKTMWTREQAREAGRRGVAIREAKKRAREEAEARARNEPPTPQYLEVLDRRLIDPNATGSRKIELKIHGSWALRWVNLELYDGRYQQVTQEQGWQPVKAVDLKDPRQVLHMNVTEDGFVARGPRDTEMLMMMPQEVFRKIQFRKVEIAKRKHRGQGLKDSINEEIATTFGRPDVAEHGQNISGEILESVEKVLLDESDRPSVD